MHSEWGRRGTKAVRVHKTEAQGRMLVVKPWGKIRDRPKT